MAPLSTGFVAGSMLPAPQHDQDPAGWVGRRLRRYLTRGRQTADVGDDGLNVFVAQFSGIRIRHHDQPTTLRIHAVADRSKYLAIRPMGESSGWRKVSRTQRSQAEVKNPANIHTARERSGP